MDELTKPVKAMLINLCPLFGRQPDRALHQALVIRDFWASARVLLLGFHAAHCTVETESQKLLAIA